MSITDLDTIKVGSRVRQDLGDIDSLAGSIQRNGLLHPVVVTSDHVLVAGVRRLEAVRQLGWSSVPVTVVDVPDMLEAERDENEQRKSFTPTEAIAVGRLVEEHEREQARERQREGGETAGRSRPIGSPESGEPIPPRHSRESADKVAKAVGMGRTKYAKAKEVMEAAETAPETFGDLPKVMDAETGSVEKAHRELKERQASPKGPVHPRLRQQPKQPTGVVLERAVTHLEQAISVASTLAWNEAPEERREEFCGRLEAAIRKMRRDMVRPLKRRPT